MSHTTILAVYPGDRIEHLEELRNSHGTAPVLWNVMCQRYLGTEPYRYLELGDELWDLYKKLTIPVAERAVFVMTFDHAWVAKANYARAAADIRATLASLPIDPRSANHWPRIAALFESDPPHPGIAFHQTSVTENPWEGPWDEAKEAHGPPPWDNAYEVYATLAEVDPALQASTEVKP